VGVLENAICTREAFVIDALRVLCKAQLESAHIQPLLARCVRLFKHQIALFKWLPALPALAPPKPKLPSVYKRLIEQLCGEESLCSAMYGMIAYVGTNQMSKTSARAKKEAKLIPDLVFYIDKFEAAVVTLGSKSKVDLLRLMKRATARDFRIQVNEVATKLKMLEAKRRQEEREKADKEGQKRKREADKASKPAKASKSTGGGKAKAAAGSGGGGAAAAAKGGSKKGKAVAAAPPAEEEGEEEMDVDDEGEEDAGEEEDGYPASMLGDDEDLDDEDA